MSHLRKRFSLAAGVATLALLALPTLAAANPGNGPELVQRSGRLVSMHMDRFDGSSSQRWVLENGVRQLPVRIPAGVWVDPGSRVRLEGTLQDGTLVLADSLSAVDQLAPAPAALAADTTAAAPSLHSVAIYLFGFTGGPSFSALPPDASTAAAAQTLAFGTQANSLNSYYLEQTYGQLGFTGKVFGPFNIVDSSGTCNELRPAALGVRRGGGGAGRRHLLPAPRLRLPAARLVPVRRDRRDRRPPRLDQRRLLRAGARARARAQPRARTRRWARLHRRRSAGAHGRLVHGRRLRVPRPVRRHGERRHRQRAVARAPDEHGAQAGAAPAADLGGEGHRDVGHLSHRADGDAHRNARAPAHSEVRRRQLLRRVPAADRLLRQPGAALRQRRPDPHRIAGGREQSCPPERRHRPDRHASRDRGGLDGRGHGPGPGVHRSPARHHDPERRPGRLRCHARDHGARRHAAAERAERSFGGRQRHDGAAALERGDRRLLGGRLRRQARRSPGRHTRHDGLHRHGPRPGHDGLLHRGGRRRRRQHRPGRHRQPCDTRHHSARRAAQGDGEGDEEGPGAAGLGRRDRQRPRDLVSDPARGQADRDRHRPRRTSTSPPSPAAARA